MARRTRWLRTLATCVLGFLLFAPLARAGENPAPIRISAIANEQTHEIAKDMLREAYARLGLRVEFEDLPARRALEWANDDITQGDLARIEGTEKVFTNLLRIPTPVTHFEGVAFAKGRSPNITTWADLEGFRVGIVRGIRYAELGTAGMEPVLARDMTHLFRLLEDQHIEIAVAVRSAGLIEVHRNFRNSGIRPVGEPLHAAPLYHFLNQNHRDLAERLAPVLAEMQRSGTIERLRQQALDRLLSE